MVSDTMNRRMVSDTKLTEVAAAVSERPDGTFLLAQRPEGKPYPGYWEFPGGKIAAGEDPNAALVPGPGGARGIHTREAPPWATPADRSRHGTVLLPCR